MIWFSWKCGRKRGRIQLLLFVQLIFGSQKYVFSISRIAFCLTFSVICHRFNLDGNLVGVFILNGIIFFFRNQRLCHNLKDAIFKTPEFYFSHDYVFSKVYIKIWPLLFPNKFYSLNKDEGLWGEISYHKFTNLTFLPVKTSGQWVTETAESEAMGKRGALCIISFVGLQHRGIWKARWRVRGEPQIMVIVRSALGSRWCKYQ